jgi:hypothetical protein
MSITLPGFSDPGFDESARPVIEAILGRPRVEVQAHRTCEDETKLQIFLVDVLDEHWPIYLTVMPDCQDLLASVRGYLTKRFPGRLIPPLAVYPGSYKEM